MRKLLFIILLTIVTACTQNNGFIGPWFGTWKLTEIRIDGVVDPDYQGNIIWKFQSDIIEMVKADDIEHTADSRWGTWVANDDNTQITLNYTHKAVVDGVENTWTYSPLAETHLPRGVLILDAEWGKNPKLLLTYLSEDGHVYTYSFKKWG